MLFEKKPLKPLIEEVSKSKELKRSLTSFGLISLGVGSIIGAGLFSLTGIAAAENAGPAVSISFVIAAIGCLFASLCYAEFASMIPMAGSAYTYSYATMGEWPAWNIGWVLVLEYALAAAAVSVSWSSYLTAFLVKNNIDFIPVQLLHSPFDGTPGIVNLPAVLIIILVSLLLIRGTSGSILINNFLVVLKISIVLIFIVVGWYYINPSNHTPYIVPNSGKFGEYGWSGIFRGAAVVFFSFLGFDAVSTTAQETKNPKKVMPIGILGSLLVCTILYVIFSYVMTGLANYTEFKNNANPVVTAIEHTPFPWLQDAITIAILAGFTSVMMMTLLGQSRIFYSMSKDGLLPKVFSEIHSKYKTPWKNNLILMIFIGVIAGFVPIINIGHLVSIGTLLAFIVVCVGIIIMRKTMPDVPRKFKTPLVPLVPILGVLVCFSMMFSLPKEAWIMLIIWLGVGSVIYFLYSIKKSNLRNK